MQMKMLRISCSGSPYEIGLRHGKEAKPLVHGTIAFYTQHFKEQAKIDWPRVREIATEFEPIIRKKWPAYLEEMQGLADGANLDLLDIIAINVRTEISFGLFTDGCTALSWTTPTRSYLAQNWDWQVAQKAHLINLTIAQPNKPTIAMITEAGLIGKIGLNSAGVGVCLNAIRAPGMDPTRLPCHLALRMVLESSSREEAVAQLDKYGVASSCHILIADGSGGVGLEWSSIACTKIRANEQGQVFHSNHYLVPQKDVNGGGDYLGDSLDRVSRIEELVKDMKEEPTMESVGDLFVDERNYPAAICRKHEGTCSGETLFNIVMDLKEKKARVLLGRPIEPEEEIELSFQ